MFRTAKLLVHGAVHASPFLKSCLLHLGGLGAILSKGSPNGVYLIFPGCNIGGAEWVHREIVSAITDANPWVVFSAPSVEPNFSSSYERAASRVIDVSRHWPHRVRRLIVLGWLSALVNKHRSPVVFGSLSPLFYQLLPMLKPHVRTIDLTHSFDGYREFWQTPYAQSLDQRIVISQTLKRQMTTVYRQLAVATDLDERIRVIPNGVDVPREPSPKPASPPLQVLFVGRGSNEGGKRVHLIGRIAKECARRSLEIEFTLVGPGIEDCLDAGSLAFVNCPGPTADASVLTDHYRRSHVLILISENEGVPIAILQAMAEGTIPLATEVGAVSECVDHSVGFLVNETSDDATVEACIVALETLSHDQERRERLSKAAHARASTSFSKEKFSSAYRNIFAVDDSCHEL